jgi:hypothetical protein
MKITKFNKYFWLNGLLALAFLPAWAMQSADKTASSAQQANRTIEEDKTEPRVFTIHGPQEIEPKIQRYIEEAKNKGFEISRKNMISIWDIDNTMVSRDPNVSKFIDREKKTRGQCPKLNKALAHYRIQVPGELLDADWLVLLQDYIDKGYPVYGCTAIHTGPYPPNDDNPIIASVQELRAKQLKDLGIQFSKPQENFTPRAPGHGLGGSVYEDGLFVTGDQKKSETIKAYWLQIMKVHPGITHLIVVDDRIENLLDLHQFGCEYGLKVILFLMKSPNIPEPDPHAEERWKLLEETEKWYGGDWPPYDAKSGQMKFPSRPDLSDPHPDHQPDAR